MAAPAGSELLKIQWGAAKSYLSIRGKILDGVMTEPLKLSLGEGSFYEHFRNSLLDGMAHKSTSNVILSKSGSRIDLESNIHNQALSALGIDSSILFEHVGTRIGQELAVKLQHISDDSVFWETIISEWKDMGMGEIEINQLPPTKIIVKDGSGLVYWPLWSVNTLINFTNQDAYAVKTWGPNELLVHGDFIQPEQLFFNLSGWNYISYPRYFPEEVEVALSSVLGNVKLLKDDSGNIYWPELGMNTIGEMESGEGYLLKVVEDQSFIYPSNSDNVDAIDGSTIAGRFSLDQPSYYSDFEKTNQNMVIGIPIASWSNFDIHNGDELAVFDEELNLVGVSVLNDENNAIVIWADDESSSKKDGMLAGEKFSFELWQSSSNNLFSLTMNFSEGLDYYNTNGISIASNIEVYQKYDSSLDYISCYPNPSSGNFSVEFYLNSDEYIDINVYNSIGERVYVANNQFMNQGIHIIPFSLSHLKQGIYYVELKSNENYKNIMIDLTK